MRSLVCVRENSVAKLDAFKGAHHNHSWRDKRPRGGDVKQAVAGCDGVLTVLVPWGNQHYSTGNAQAVLDYARPGARLVFSCGWHITRDGQRCVPAIVKKRGKDPRAGSRGLFPSLTLTIK